MQSLLKITTLLVLLAASATAQINLSGNVFDGSGGPLLSGQVYHTTGFMVPSGQILADVVQRLFQVAGANRPLLEPRSQAMPVIEFDDLFADHLGLFVLLLVECLRGLVE